MSLIVFVFEITAISFLWGFGVAKGVETAQRRFAPVPAAKGRRRGERV